MTTTAECAWTASADASWVARIDPSSGQGSGTLQVAVAANPSGIARQTDVVVNGARAAIRQSPAACVSTLSDSSQTLDAGGAAISVSVATPAGCAWTAVSDETWISVAAGASGSGPGVVQLRVDANSGSARSGVVRIAGQSFTVIQEGGSVPGGSQTPAGCTYAVSSQTQTIPATGGGGSIALTTTCAWSLTTSAAWITLQSPTSGTGNGTISFSVPANTGAARTGTINVGGTVITISQAAAASCAFTVTPTTVNAPVGGSTGSAVTVSTTPPCTWTATTTATWITITAGASGIGSGGVTFNTAANSGPARSGIITVAGQPVTVTQPAAPCSFTVNPLSVSIGSAATNGQSVSVTAGSGCSWTAASNASWITLTSGATGTGPGSVTFNVAANNGAARSGSLTVAGQTVNVSQGSGCAATVNPLTVSVPSTATNGQSVSVTAGGGCSWTAASNDSWITLTAGATGTGSGSVTFNVGANTGAARSGSLTVAGQTVNVSQAAGCSFTVSPLTVSAPSTATSGQSVSVTAGSGCSWTAASNDSWITLTAGATGTGSGSVTFNVGANTGAARSGSLTVAGQTVTVNQSGAPACAFTVVLTPTSFRDEGGTGNGTVTTAPGCAWTTTTATSWIIITSGASGSGSGTVRLTIQPNPGGNRTGAVTIAGQTFTIMQSNK